MAGAADLKFLVVDDMVTMRKLITQQLKMHGVSNITEAADGAAAWELVQKAEGGPFQFIISDWNMPNMTGLDFLKKVRSHPNYKNVAFLLVTAEAEANQVSSAVTEGVDNYLVKPFTAESFGEKLKSVLSKRGL